MFSRLPREPETLTRWLDAAEVRELAALAGYVRAQAGDAIGTSMTARLGRGHELHGHDRYRPGDDARAIDWRARIRTGELWVRRHRAEGDGGIRILVDNSASMSVTKQRLAARLAAAFTVVADAAALEVSIEALCSAGVNIQLRQRSTRFALAALNRISPPVRIALQPALGRARHRVRPDEQVVLISDLADPAPTEELAIAIARLSRRAGCVHIVDAADAELPADVDQLGDAERGERRPIDDAIAMQFPARVTAWRQSLANAMRHHRVPLVVADAARPGRLVDTVRPLVATWR